MDDFEEEIDYMDIPPYEDLKPSKEDMPSDNFQNIGQKPEKVEDEPLNSNKEGTSSQEEKTATGEIPQKEENPNEQDSAKDLKKPRRPSSKGKLPMQFLSKTQPRKKSKSKSQLRMA